MTKKLYIAAAMTLGLGLLALILVALPTLAVSPKPQALSFNAIVDEVAWTDSAIWNDAQRNDMQSSQSAANEIHFKPNRVLVVSGVQMRDDYVIHEAWGFGDVVALLKLWGVPFDTLRLDTQAMTLTHFLDNTGEPKSGTIIWTARQDQYPWQPQDYSILAQAVITHNISLIAVGNKIREPVIQDLLGLVCGDTDGDCLGQITNTVIFDSDHFVTRELSGTVFPDEAFFAGEGPQVTVTATGVVSTLATAGSWPQLTVRTINQASRTRAVWIGGHPDYVFHSSPTFIQLLQHSLVWALGYGVYKDYGHSIVLRIDDPGAPESAYSACWNYQQLNAVTLTNSIVTPLLDHAATLGVAFVPGYPLIPTCSITRSCLVDFHTRL